jgi:hypothetical protein
LEGTLKDFAHAVDLALVEDIVGFLEELDTEELEELFIGVPWPEYHADDTRLISKFIADAIRHVWVGCNLSDKKMETIFRSVYPFLKDGDGTLTPIRVREVFLKLRQVCTKRVSGDVQSLIILCHFAIMKQKKLSKERYSQGVITNFLGTNQAMPDRDSMWGTKLKKHDDRLQESTKLLKELHKLDAGDLMERLLKSAAKLEQLGALRLKQPTWDGKSTTEREALQRLGFLFSMYRCEFWYWEAWESIRKLLLSSVLLFVWDGTAGQVCAGFFLSTLSLILSLNWQPHSLRELQATYSYTLFVEAVTHLSGLMLITSGFQDIVGTDDANEKFVLGLGLIFLHVASFLVPLALYVFMRITQALYVFMRITQVIQRHLPTWVKWDDAQHSTGDTWVSEYETDHDHPDDVSWASNSVIVGDIGFEDHVLADGTSVPAKHDSIHHTMGFEVTLGLNSMDTQTGHDRPQVTLEEDEAAGIEAHARRNPTTFAAYHSRRLDALKHLRGEGVNDQTRNKLRAALNFRAVMRQRKEKELSLFDEESPMVFC